MSTSVLTLESFILHIRDLPAVSEIYVEDRSLVMTISHRAYDIHQWLEEADQEERLEYKEGWSVKLSCAFLVEDLLEGIANRMDLRMRPALSYQGTLYDWYFAARVPGGLRVPEAVDLLNILVADEFPHKYFRKRDHVG